MLHFLMTKESVQTQFIACSLMFSLTAFFLTGSDKACMEHRCVCNGSLHSFPVIEIHDAIYFKSCSGSLINLNFDERQFDYLIAC